MNNTTPDNVCCPKFEPANWNEKVLEWNNKKFIKDKVFTFFYIPLNFGSVMKRLDKMIRASGITTPDSLTLSDHTSKWNMDLYLAVDKEISGACNVALSGQFLCKVYEGNFQETGNWSKDFDSYAKAINYDIKKKYMWYTTCPKCAKKYGHNYVVIIGQIE